MDLQLRGRKALVTGASKGIGREVARQLAAEGCDLVLAARSEDEMNAVRDEIAGRHNVSVAVVPTDLSVSENQRALASGYPEIDVLVNNAGAIPGGRIDEIDEATWRAAWDLKVFGYINITREFYALMKERGSGVIVNVIGNGGEAPSANYIAGAAGNAALMAFTRALGGNSPADGVRVVGINPGPVLTERLDKLLRKSAADRLGDAERWQELVDPFPFNRAATPEEIASMVAFLASDLSAYTSGTVVTIDGGQVNRDALF